MNLLLDRRLRGWLPLLVLLVSLAPRLVLWSTAARRLEPRYDEAMYYERAQHFDHLLQAWTHDTPVDPEDVEGFYWYGRWPPLHSMLQGVVLFALGDRVWYARLVSVVLSSLTTVVIYVLALRITGRVWPALAAAAIHAFHPSFLSFSHLLWSESTYIFFWMLLLWFTIEAADAARTVRPRGPARDAGWRRGVDAVTRRAGPWPWAVLAGVALGLAGLARAAALPLFLLLPAWLAWESRRRILAAVGLALVMLLVACLVVWPWQSQIQRHEHHTLLLTTVAWENVYLGNNPYIPTEGDDFGSSWGDPESRNRALRGVDDQAREQKIHPSDAARQLALDEIRRDKASFLRRTFLRLCMLLTPDFFTIRHVASVTYPPVAPTLLGVLWMWIAWVHVAVFTLAAWGLTRGGGSLRHGFLLAIAALATIAPPLVTISMSRLNLPLQALLLPLAGLGMVPRRGHRPVLSPGLRRWARWRNGVLTAGTAILVAAAGWSTIPRIVGHYLDASAYYAPVLDPLAARLGTTTRYSDRIQLQRVSRARIPLLQISFTDEGYHVPRTDHVLRLHAPARLRQRSEFDVFASSPIGPMVCELRSPRQTEALRLSPLTRETWRQWTPTGVSGLEYRWLGSRTRNLQ
jgi:4-amino-4-deoxy-L-arabinose transferase-like glycosyltransferase